MAATFFPAKVVGAASGARHVEVNDVVAHPVTASKPTITADIEANRIRCCIP
jgi:hypothetical protein